VLRASGVLLECIYGIVQLLHGFELHSHS